MHGHHQEHFVTIYRSNDWVSCHYGVEVLGFLNELDRSLPAGKKVFERVCY
jgi:hypothetical protein